MAHEGDCSGPLGFENELRKLQEAVGRLESPDLTLEEAFACLEQGSAAYRACRDLLSAAKCRAEVLVKDFPDEPGSWQPFAWETGDGTARDREGDEP